MMKRREFLKISATGLAGAAGAIGMLSWMPRAYAATVSKTYYITEGLIAFPGQVNGTPADVDVYFKGFSSASNTLTVPGESFIVQEGDTVEVTIVNTLDTTHSFVIDGMVDSGPIAGGQTKTVSFTANSVGSHLFYDSTNAPYNRLVGLHGGMAVMPFGSSNELYAGSPTFTQQLFWVMHDIDPDWHARIQNGQTPNTTYTPRHFTLNGLIGRPPGAVGSKDPAVDAMVAPGTALHGHVGEPALLRVLNPGKCMHSVHTHGNHMHWLTSNGQVRPAIWQKDIVPMDGNMGKVDVIFPFEAPPDAWPQVTTGIYAMHLHDEMTQTSGGGYYMFGNITDIFFE